MPVPPSSINVIRPRVDPSLVVNRFRAINPNSLGGDGPQSAQISLDQVKAKGLLILPPGPPTFDTLFIDPSTGRKLALPRWKIATGMVNGQSQRRVTMDPVAGQPSWKLMVHLEPDTPASGSDGLIGAPQVAPVPSIMIQYMASDVPPFSVAEDSGGLVATLVIDDINTVIAIKHAMTDPRGGCKLVVKYPLNVATPIGQPPIRRPTLVLKFDPSLTRNAAPPQLGTLSEPVTRPVIRTVPTAFHPPRLPATTPLPHTTTPLPHTTTPLPHTTTPLPHTTTPLPHTTTPLPHTTPTTTTTTTPHTTPTTTTTPHTTPTTTGTPVDPKPLYISSTVTPALELAFIFDATIEPVFQNLAVSGSGNPAAPSVYSLDFEGAMYPYVKVNTAPDTFFYLPDSFKLCRSPDSPYYPQMSLTISGDNLETATVALTYLAVPVINSRRLDDARQKLATYGVTKDGKPLGAPNPQLLLSWPGVKPGDGMYPPRPGLVVDLAAGFQDTLTLTTQQFLDLVDALFTGAGSQFFQGYVTVHIDQDNEPHIKFSGRADDLVASNLFDHTKSLDAASGGVRVVLTNGTEATLHVDELATQLVQGDGSSVDGRVVSITPAPPCDVAPLTADGQPAGTIEVIMAPTTGVAAADWDIAFDLSKVQDKVERESFLAAISDSSVAGHVTRVVHVRSPSAPFQTRPERYLTALVVTFAGGRSIELDKNSPTVGDNLTADAQLPVSMIDYLVRRVDLQPYQYKRQLIYSDGAKVVDTEWTEDTSDILFVSLDPAPVT